MTEAFVVGRQAGAARRSAPSARIPHDADNLVVSIDLISAGTPAPDLNTAELISRLQNLI